MADTEFTNTVRKQTAKAQSQLFHSNQQDLLLHAETS